MRARIVAVMAGVVRIGNGLWLWRGNNRHEM
jgi:hypothetical protein